MGILYTETITAMNEPTNNLKHCESAGAVFIDLMQVYRISIDSLASQ